MRFTNEDPETEAPSGAIFHTVRELNEKERKTGRSARDPGRCMRTAIGTSMRDLFGDLYERDAMIICVCRI